MNRICSLCKIEKDLDKFYKSRVEKLGREYRCIECVRLKNKKYIEKDRAGWNKRRSDYDQKKLVEDPDFWKKKYARFKSSYLDYKKNNLDKDRKKHNAQSQINWNVKHGKIEKPKELARKIIEIPGVIEVGLFTKPDIIYKAKENGKFEVLT